MKDTMIGMLPSGTYVLARLDGTPYSQGEYEMLLRDLETLERDNLATRKALFKDLDRNQDDIKTPSLAIVAGNALADLRATVASQAKKLEALETCLISKDAALRDGIVLANGRASEWGSRAEAAFKRFEEALDIQPTA